MPDALIFLIPLTYPDREQTMVAADAAQAQVTIKPKHLTEFATRLRELADKMDTASNGLDVNVPKRVTHAEREAM